MCCHANKDSGSSGITTDCGNFNASIGNEYLIEMFVFKACNHLGEESPISWLVRPDLGRAGLIFLRVKRKNRKKWEKTADTFRLEVDSDEINWTILQTLPRCMGYLHKPIYERVFIKVQLLYFVQYRHDDISQTLFCLCKHSTSAINWQQKRKKKHCREVTKNGLQTSANANCVFCYEFRMLT